MQTNKLLGLTMSAIVLTFFAGFFKLPDILPQRAKAETSQVYQKQNIDESRAKAQQSLYELCDDNNYPHFDMMDFKERGLFWQQLGSNEGFPDLVKPSNKLRAFANSIIQSYSLEARLKKFQMFLYENSEPDNLNVFSPEELIDDFERAKKENSNPLMKPKIKANCFSLSCLYLNWAQTEPGVEEAYLCEVIKDIDGSDFRLKNINRPEGNRHGVVALKVRGLRRELGSKWILVDVTEERGFNFPYKEVEIINPADVNKRGIILKAVELRKKGLPLESIAMVDKIAQVYPQDHDCLYQKGVSYLRRDNTEALLNLLAADKIKPNIFYCMNALALTYREIGELNTALQKIEECLKLYPDYGIGHYTYARIKWDLGEHDPARDIFKRAMKLRPLNLDNEIPLEIYHLIPKELLK